MDGHVDERQASGAVDAAGLEAEMDSELAGLREETPGGRRHPRNPVYLHEQAAGSAVAADEATETAARVTGELATEADGERRRIEGQVASIERSAPGSARAEDAEAARVAADRDADGAVAASLDSGAAADDARSATGSRFLHRGAEADRSEADEARALADERTVTTDLVELDALERRVEADGAAGSGSVVGGV
jgi:hypothetical protein